MRRRSPSSPKRSNSGKATRRGSRCARGQCALRRIGVLGIDQPRGLPDLELAGGRLGVERLARVGDDDVEIVARQIAPLDDVFLVVEQVALEIGHCTPPRAGSLAIFRLAYDFIQSRGATVISPWRRIKAATAALRT